MQFEITPDNRWRLVKGGEVIAASPQPFDSEADARSAAADLKKSAGGFRFAKVVTVPKEDTTS